LDPKAKKNVYKIENGTSIIDLTKTITQLAKAVTFLEETAKRGEQILVVGTKKVASSYVKDYCAQNNIPCISSKWLPGLLTNFETLINNVKKLKTLKNDRDTGEWEKLVKHERTQLSKQITKLEKLYGGLETMEGKPQVLVVIDPKKEKNAVKEAKTFHLPVVAIVDTNANPDPIDFPVVANDDAAEVVEHIMTSLLQPYVKSFVKQEKKPEPIQEIKES
jgi:small subunit ribosomal protein S2